MVVPRELATYIVALTAGCGLVFLTTTIVRTLGRRLEARLTVRWNGMPTTHRLRHCEVQDRPTFNRRRVTLEALIGRRLPSRRAELANPARADQEYIAATRQLIALVRQRAERFPRVQDENINYGFVRNMLALKAIALISLTVSAVMCVGIRLLIDSLAETLAIGVTHLVLAGVWVFYATPERVWEAGSIYADRLLECLETPSAFDDRTLLAASDGVTHRQ